MADFNDRDGPGGAAREAEESAGRIEAAFERASRTISDSMARAGRSGALSMQTMAEDILNSLARIAVDEFVTGPLESLIEQGLGGIGEAIGARASGGPVIGGERYIVGENGPEVFTPGRSGGISPMGGGPVVNVTINASGADAAGAARRSQGQIAATVARAARAGSGRL